jgi:hypothetical protein
MHLPRPLLLRIRRAIRRQLAMQPLLSDLIAIDETSQLQGRRQPTPPARMKPWLLIIAVVLALAYVSGLVGCTTVTTTAKDGTVTSVRAPSPGVLPFASELIRAYSPRPIRIRQEKSGRISAKEIRERWQPNKSR